MWGIALPLPATSQNWPKKRKRQKNTRSLKPDLTLPKPNIATIFRPQEKKAKTTTMGAQDFIFKPNFTTSLTFETFNALELHPTFLVKGKKLWDPLDVKGNFFGNASMWKLWDPLDVKGNLFFQILQCEAHFSKKKASHNMIRISGDVFFY